eukprot:13530456-Ditylum_brightwellii.AAC.1
MLWRNSLPKRTNEGIDITAMSNSGLMNEGISEGCVDGGVDTFWIYGREYGEEDSFINCLVPCWGGEWS